MNILIVTYFEDFGGPPRLLSRFKSLSVGTSVFCPKGSIITKSHHIDRLVEFEKANNKISRNYYDRLVELILDVKPALIIPGDDFTVWLLQELRRKTKNKSVLPYLNRSLCHQDFHKVVLSKDLFLKEVSSLGVRVPKTLLVNKTSVEAQVNNLGLPCVVKQAQSYGGKGVAICHNIDEVHEFLSMHKSSGLQRAKSHIRRFVYGQRSFGDAGCNIQQFIDGPICSVAFAALEGRLLGMNIFETVECHPAPKGPSTVVRRFQDNEIKEFVKTIVAKLNYSGLGGLDFLIHKGTKKPYVIEINPRTTPTCHLNDPAGNDLIKALVNGLNGNPQEHSEPAPSEQPFSALFPSEARRDQGSFYIRHHFYDFPHDDLPLANAFLPGSSTSLS